VLTIENHGPLIVATNYWDSEWSEKCKIAASTNAGAVRILLPPAYYHLVGECRSAKYAILSRGPWPAAGGAEGVEILFEDGTDDPFCLHLAVESFDVLPAEPEPGREWIVSLWVQKKNRPHKGLERACKWRRVPRIPWLKPWGK
jgi:hypothetical protein